MTELRATIDTAIVNARRPMDGGDTVGEIALGDALEKALGKLRMRSLKETILTVLNESNGSCMDDADEVEALATDLTDRLQSMRQRTFTDKERGTLTTLLLAEIDVLETTAKESRDSNMYNWEKAILADRDRLIELANAIGGGSF